MAIFSFDNNSFNKISETNFNTVIFHDHSPTF